MSSEPRAVPVHLIEEPALAARTEMDDAALDELASSIRELGVLSPLHLRPVADGRFEVIAGHRRLLAARMLGLPSVPAYVSDDVTRVEAVKLHENVMREELHPVDEAVFFAELYERNGQDIERVADLVKRPRDYVSRRLLLLQGDAAVRDALRHGLILVGVAEELNRLTSADDVRYYLEYAVRGGCSVGQMRQWRKEANARREFQETAGVPDTSLEAVGSGPGTGAPAGPSYLGLAQPHELSSSREVRECWFCRGMHEEWQMFKKFVCRPCADTHLAPQLMEEVSRGQIPR